MRRKAFRFAAFSRPKGSPRDAVFSRPDVSHPARGRPPAMTQPAMPEPAMTHRDKPREPDRPLHAPMGDVLARVAHELNHVCARIGHFETLAGPLILGAARRDAGLMRHIQDLDHIRQKVAGLADFLAALAPLAPGDCLVDASGAARLVTLADLAARLALSDEDSATPGAAGGDFELF